jgi:hypothetical protein
MNEIAVIRKVEREERNGVTNTDINVDPGGGANVTIEQMHPSGTDSRPLPGDYVAGISIKSTGRKIAIGFIDPSNTPKTNPGEHRIYSRDTSGTPVTEIWLKNDGSININNDNGFINITPAGIVELNGNADFIIAFTDMKAAFDELKTDFNNLVTVVTSHVHSGVTTGSGTSGASTTPGVASTADMSGAKVDTVKVP